MMCVMVTLMCEDLCKTLKTGKAQRLWVVKETTGFGKRPLAVVPILPVPFMAAAVSWDRQNKSIKGLNRL